MESYLDFSPSGEGALRSVDRSEFFSAVGLSGLRRGPEESIASFCSRVAERLRGTLATSEGAQADLDLRRFLFLFWEKIFFANLIDSLSYKLLIFLNDLDNSPMTSKSSRKTRSLQDKESARLEKKTFS